VKAQELEQTAEEKLVQAENIGKEILFFIILF
jgi:hypothetical protein